MLSPDNPAMNDHLTPVTEAPAADNPSAAPTAQKPPGKIQSEPITIILHSTQAYNLYIGRPRTPERRGFIGLEQFSRAVARIADHDHQDRVEEALEDGEERIRQIKAQINKSFARNHLAGPTTAASDSPAEIEVKLSNRLAHRGAQLLTEYDSAVRRCIILYKLGVHNRKEHGKMIHTLSKIVRRAYFSPFFTMTEVVAGQKSVSAATGEDTTPPPSPGQSTAAQD